MNAPFPYFGGKSRVAPVVWARFGDVDNYVEPFMGSLAVLLARPENHACNAETVNDLDYYLANFWRALQAAPDDVARWADWPVNECDLTARHLWLVNEGRARIANLDADPLAYDAQVAGWWVWGLCAWIGSGWCSGAGPWANVDGKLSKRPHLGNAGQGVNRQLPHLGDAGQGAIYDYLQTLANRLRRVRVCCGDWQRVVTRGALNYGTTVGVFLDPPYAASTERDMTLYTNDADNLSADVRAWALANGDNPRYRIALCGYDGEHTMPNTWTVHAWSAKASYKTSNGDGNGRRHLERIYFSPHCLTDAKMPDLWSNA